MGFIFSFSIQLMTLVLYCSSFSKLLFKHHIPPPHLRKVKINGKTWSLRFVNL
uniref:Uncharacterized protein n=1 Tax=Anguilla anguilla TaxID=7936 RepID=A0A0E9P777_ANGAN